MKPYRILTLGCKVNQCESAALGHLLEEAGWSCSQETASPAVIVINTCTVTGRAAMQSRQAIRRTIREYPSAKVVVTGCYAQTAADEIRAIPGVDLIVGHTDKMRIAEVLSGPHDTGLSPCERSCADISCAFAALAAVDSRERTRAFLKIQDGCNTRCTYCIVPYARGRSRSMPVEDVRTHLCRLGAEGFHEAVLTGIHLGAYGSDLKPATSLAELLAGLIRRPTVERIRFSSIEPTEVDDTIIEMMKDSKSGLCRHFHIPLQSGDDGVLRRMGRPYSSERFTRIVEDIQARIPDIAIGVDVMAGFPGETQDAFLNTYRLIDSLPVSYLHVFPFSARKGTPAAAFKERVPQSIAKERCRVLRALGAKKKTAFHQRMVGRMLTVLIETVADVKTGYAKGLSDNYVPVAIPDLKLQENTLVDVRIVELKEDGTVIGKAL